MIQSEPLKEGGGDGDIMAKDIMCLPEKHEDLSSDHQQPGTAPCGTHLELQCWGQQTGRALGLANQLLWLNPGLQKQ